LVVTSPTQVAEMKMAREGRLFLKEKRISIEKARKELKEQSLREGQTIDAIAKILKNLIEPIESHLETQEKFIEIREAAMKAERKEKRVSILLGLEYDFQYLDILNMPDETFETLVLTIENERDAKKAAEAKAELERLAAIEAEKVEREKYRIENERLQSEAKERERLAQIEREKMQAEAEAQRIKAEAELLAQRIEAERIAKIEAEKQSAIQAELRAKAEAEAKERAKVEAELRAKAEAEAKAANAPDKEKLMKLASLILSVELPNVTSEEAKAIVNDVKNLLSKVNAHIIAKSNPMKKV